MRLGSAQDELVDDDEGVDGDEGDPHERAYASDEMYHLGLDAGVVLDAAEARIGRGGAPADTCQEAVFGQDGNGIDEQDGDVEQPAEAEEEHFGGTTRGLAVD